MAILITGFQKPHTLAGHHAVSVVFPRLRRVGRRLDVANDLEDALQAANEFSGLSGGYKLSNGFAVSRDEYRFSRRVHVFERRSTMRV
jgi:hypothetical protein